MSIMILAVAMMAQAPAAQPSMAQPAASATAPAEKEKKICKVDENESSSRLRKRVCMTQSEWDRKESGVQVNDLKNMGAH